MAGVPFPPDRVLSQTESGRPKTERLMELESLHPGLENVFVEDKLSTLEKVCGVRKCGVMLWTLRKDSEVKRGYRRPMQSYAPLRVQLV